MARYVNPLFIENINTTNHKKIILFLIISSLNFIWTCIQQTTNNKPQTIPAETWSKSLY
jgi:hypothetical protein